MTPKQAWPQASHQLNPALFTRMLIPVPLYIFTNHIGTVFRIWIWYPFQIEPLTFYLCSPPRRQWLIVHQNDCITVHNEDTMRTVNYEDLYFHVITLCSLDVTVIHKWFPAPLEKNGPYAYVRFNGHFAGEPGLAGIFIEAKDDGSGGGDNLKL